MASEGRGWSTLRVPHTGSAARQEEQRAARKARPWPFPTPQVAARGSSKRPAWHHEAGWAQRGGQRLSDRHSRRCCEGQCGRAPAQLPGAKPRARAACRPQRGVHSSWASLVSEGPEDRARGEPPRASAPAGIGGSAQPCCSAPLPGLRREACCREALLVEPKEQGGREPSPAAEAPSPQCGWHTCW